MKASRIYLGVVGTVFGIFTAVIIISLFGYFKSLERGNVSTPSEGRLVSQLLGFHDQLELLSSPDGVKLAFKTFEASSGFGADSPAMSKLKQAYSPIVALLGSRQKESEENFLLARKRDLMEGLVNAYRKEIPNGDIKLRAAYLNILFDVQNNLANDSAETEAVFAKRARERFNGLKAIAASSGNSALELRVSALEGVFQSYEKGFDLYSRWKKQKTELFSQAKKNVTGLAKEMRGSSEDNLESYRRGFLYITLFAVLTIILGGIALMVTQKLLRLRFDSRVDSLIHYLSGFGREGDDGKKAVPILEADEDWRKIIKKAVEFENNFFNHYQSQISVSKSLTIPFIVFSRDKVVQNMNRAAEELFGEKFSPATLDHKDLINTAKIATKEGSAEVIVEMLRNSFQAPKQDIFECLLIKDKDFVPVEVISEPIITGPLAGGKVYLVREIRNEAQRIEQAVEKQLYKIRDYTHKITHEYTMEIEVGEKDLLPVRETLIDLNTMKMKVDEREALWKSEARALCDQVERQSDLLGKIGDELSMVKDKNQGLQRLLALSREFDENLFQEVSLFEKDLDRWTESRDQLSRDVKSHSELALQAKAFEAELRKSVEGIKGVLKAYEEDFHDLNEFVESARLQAVNVSLEGGMEHRSFATNARALAENLRLFSDHISALLKKLRSQIEAHPAGGPLSVLNADPVSEAALANLHEEHNKLRSFLTRWKDNGLSQITSDKEAQGIAKEIDQAGVAARQLGEKTILITQQAHANLNRWI